MAGGIEEGDGEEMSAINVTPFIDVMLVLMIIFMVTAPLATVSLPVDLPVSSTATRARPDHPVFVSVTADGGLAVGDRRIDRAELAAALDGATGGDKEQRIFLRGDRAVAYDAVMAAMNGLRSAGYLKVALVGLEATP